MRSKDSFLIGGGVNNWLINKEGPPLIAINRDIREGPDFKGHLVLLVALPI